MKNIKSFRIIEIVMFMTFFYSLFCTQTYFGSNNYGVFSKLFFLVFAFFLLLVTIKNEYFLSLENHFFYMLAMLSIPYLLLMIFSFAMCYVNPGLSIYDARTENIQPFLIVLASSISYIYFREHLVDIIWLACVLNYSIYVLEFIRINGVLGLLHFIDLTDNSPTGLKPLEVHEVTFILSLLLLYYILRYYSQRKWQIIITIVYVFLGYKRIALGAILASIIVFFYLKRCSNKINRSKNIAVVLLVLCILWVIYTSSDLYYIVSFLLNIELNGRDILMARMRGVYSLSLFYLGHGVGFAHHFLSEWVKYDSTAHVDALHNDILKYYIDLGCIPSFLFFLNMIYLNLSRVSKCGEIYAVRYIVLMVFLIICWFTDNLASYPNFLFVYHVVVMALMCDSDCMEKTLKEVI